LDTIDTGVELALETETGLFESPRVDSGTRSITEVDRRAYHDGSVYEVAI